MTLHELLKVVPDFLTPDSGLLYDYLLYTSDDNGGFLRTRFCWWPERAVTDKELSGEKNVNLIAMASEMDEKILQDKKPDSVKASDTLLERKYKVRICQVGCFNDECFALCPLE